MLKFQYFGHLMRRADSLGKTLMLEKIRQDKKMMTEDGVVEWQLNRHDLTANTFLFGGLILFAAEHPPTCTTLPSSPK